MLAGSMLLAGCAQKTVTNDQAMDEVAPAPEQEAPMAAEAETGTALPVLAVAPEPEPSDERLADKIFFDLNSHLLTTASKKALEGHADWLQAQPEVRIVIEGHADERGSPAHHPRSPSVYRLSSSARSSAASYSAKIGSRPSFATRAK